MFSILPRRPRGQADVVEDWSALCLDVVGGDVPGSVKRHAGNLLRCHSSAANAGKKEQIANALACG
jgi:hypothetical protein